MRTACPFCLMDKDISTKKGLKIGEFCIQAALVILALSIGRFDQSQTPKSRKTANNEGKLENCSFL